MGDRLVRWGLPRAANAVPLLMEFIVVTVATVLAIRFALFITGYPQLGGGGLHIAHVLWGGLLMALGTMALLSFNGRAIKPVATFAAGVGFGLFIDEVGKFLTSDNDYFFTPSIAIMYVVIVLLVLAVHAVHGRRPLSPRELYIAALTSAASGLATGMTDTSRELALRRIAAAGDAPGATQAAGLVRAIPRGSGDRYDVTRLGARVAAALGRLLRTRAAIRTTVVVLLIQTVVTLGIALFIVSAALARAAGADVTLRFDDPIPTAIGGASAVLSAACVVVGVVRLRQGRRVSGFRWLERGVLIDVLLTRVFEFAAYQFAAIPALVIDLLLLGALEYAIRHAVNDEAAVGDAAAERAEAARAHARGPSRAGSRAGVVGGATASGCGAVAGSLVAGVATPSAAGVDADAGAGTAPVASGLGPAPEVAGSGGAGPAAGSAEAGPAGGRGVPGDEPVPSAADAGAGGPVRRRGEPPGPVTAAPAGGSAARSGDRGTGAVGRPPGARWLGSRSRNASGGRYASRARPGRRGDNRRRTDGSTVESVTPPPLS